MISGGVIVLFHRIMAESIESQQADLSPFFSATHREAFADRRVKSHLARLNIFIEYFDRKLIIGDNEYGNLTFPFKKIPEIGEITNISDDIIWYRILLPYKLDHVNVYLIRDRDSWAIVDTGINTPEACAAWDRLFGQALPDLAVSRVIVTHHHPDHIGLAGWLCEKFGAELLTSQTSYMSSRVLSLAP